MELTVFLSKIIGLTYVVMGFGMLLNQETYRKLFKEMLDSRAFLFLSGLMVMVIGFVMVMKHNIWDGGFAVLVTLFGWLALIKGVLILLFPDSMIDISKSFVKSEKNLQLYSFLIIAFGLIFSYFGFMA